MDVTLTPELEDLVNSKVRAGHYDSASDVVREALRIMGEYDELKFLQKAEIGRKIAAGVASAHAGRLSDGELFMAEMIAELDAEMRRDEESDTPDSPAGT